MPNSSDNHDAASSNIDTDGYRPNVGMVICDQRGRVFWARRAGQSGWQFPQGGVNPGEDPVQAMYRELHEEVGLTADHIELLGQTGDWLKYRLPARYRRQGPGAECIGQKQRWFLLRFAGDAAQISFDHHENPEFDRWRWVDYWYPVNHVIYFKRHVYKRALKELKSFL